MSKIYKIEMYVLDIDSNCKNANDIIDEIDLSLPDGCYLQPISKKASKEFKWHDSIDLNHNSATLETYENYFR